MKKRLLAGIVAAMVCGISIAVPFDIKKDSKKEFSKSEDTMIKSTNSLARLMNSVEEEQKDAERPSLPQAKQFVINNAEYDDVRSVLKVKSTQEESCRIVVTVTSDSDETVTPLQYTAMVSKGEYTETLFTIDRSDLPEYFVMSVELEDLPFYIESQPFVITKYTQKIQEIQNTHADDFESGQVVNLDDDNETNFLVLNEDTVYAETTEDTNILCSADYDNGCFVFENADSTVTDLKKGDYFYIQPDENNIIAISVDGIEKEGNKTIVYDSQDPVEDMFDFIKIESYVNSKDLDYGEKYEAELREVYNSESSAENQEMPEKKLSSEEILTEEEIENISVMENNLNDSRINIDVSVPLDELYAKIFVRGRMDFSLEVDFYLSKDYRSFSSKLKVNISATGGVSTSAPVIKKETDVIKGNKELSLKSIVVALGATGCYAELKPSFVLEINGWFTCTWEKEFIFGMAYDTNNGFCNISDFNQPQKFSSEMYADVTFAFKTSLSLVFVNSNIASITLSDTIGLRIKAKIDLLLEDEKTPVYNRYSIQKIESDKEYLHACNSCVSGEVHFFYSIDASAKFAFGLLEPSISLNRKTFKLSDWYYSDMVGFGTGTCPNYLYQVNYIIENNPEKDGISSIYMYSNADSKGYSIPVNNNHAKAYCKIGNYKYTANIKSTSQKIEQEIEVYDTPKYIKIRVYDTGTADVEQNDSPDRNDYDTGEKYDPDKEIEPVVTAPSVPGKQQTERGKLGDNISYFLYDSGELQIYGNGEMYNFKESPFKEPEKIKYVSTFENCPTESSEYDEETGEFIRTTKEGKITNIGNHVFDGCINLASFEIPESVTRIGIYAFKNCQSFDKVNIHSNITFIDNNAFEGCTGLTEITIPDNVTNIGTSAFSGCTGLTEITIPDNVTNIGTSAFSGCSNLKTAVVGEGIKNIPRNMFNGCYKLETLTYPSVETNEFSSAWYGTTPKTAYSDLFEEDSNIYNSLENYSLKKIIISSGTEISVGAFKGITIPFSVDLPDTITTIERKAFEGCTGITNITFGDALENIDFNAFAGCKNLKTVYLGSSVKSIGNNAFYECYALERLSTSYTSNLKNFFGVNEDIPEEERESYSLKKVEVLNSESFNFADLNGVDTAETVVLSADIAKISTDKVSENSSIRKIFFTGSDEKWNTLIESSELDLEGYTVKTNESFETNDYVYEVYSSLVTDDEQDTDTVSGDIDGNDVINIRDIIIFSRYLAGGWNISDINEAAADINGDGKINIVDLIYLKRMLSGGW